MAKKSAQPRPKEVVFSGIKPDEFFVFFTFERDCKKVFPGVKEWDVLVWLFDNGFISIHSFADEEQNKPTIYKAVKAWNSQTKTF